MTNMRSVSNVSNIISVLLNYDSNIVVMSASVLPLALLYALNVLKGSTVNQALQKASNVDEDFTQLRV